MRHAKRTLRFLGLLLLVTLPATTAALKSGRTTCPASGVKQLSSTVTKATWIALQAPADNTGTIVFGGTNAVAVTSCNGTIVGNCLIATGTSFLPPVSNTAAYDLSQTWFACTVAADVISYNYLQ